MNNYIILITFLFPEKFSSHTWISLLELPFFFLFFSFSFFFVVHWITWFMAEVDRSLWRSFSPIGCPGPCPDSFWIAPEMVTSTQPVLFTAISWFSSDTDTKITETFDVLAACWLLPLLSVEGAGWHLHYCYGMWHLLSRAVRGRQSSQTSVRN